MIEFLSSLIKLLSAVIYILQKVLIPFKDFTIFSETLICVSEGKVVVMLCPKFFKYEYPVPLHPWVGVVKPPVAIIIFLAVIFLLFEVIIKFEFNFFISVILKDVIS